MCIHHIRRITRVAHEAIKEKAWLCNASEMDREERLRRPREQDRARRVRETVEEREARLGRQKEYKRTGHAGMTNLQ